MPVLQFRKRDAEQRRAVRHRVHVPVYITAGDPPQRLNCMLHDLSMTGARLTVGPQAAVPDRFTLVFTRTCRVVRRADGQVGVEFVAPGPDEA
jgi:hypothetical protein